MGDEENKKEDAKDGSKDKVDDDGPKEPGCCFKFGQCILDTFK